MEQYHFDVILQEDVAEFPELYGAVADAYFEKKFFAEALNVYQEMATNDDVSQIFKLKRLVSNVL